MTTCPHGRNTEHETQGHWCEQCRDWGSVDSCASCAAHWHGRAVLVAVKAENERLTRERDAVLRDWARDRAELARHRALLDDDIVVCLVNAARRDGVNLGEYTDRSIVQWVLAALRSRVGQTDNQPEPSDKGGDRG